MKTNHSLLAVLVCSLLFFAQSVFANLNDIKIRGQLKVALYKEFPPFSNEGRGIDVEIAGKIAEKLRVKLDILWFPADENVEDDLRNFLWKGHYLGYGTADIMFHIPTDPLFAERNKQVKIFAPYYREQIQVARSLNRLPTLYTLEIFGREKIGVEMATVSDNYLLSAFGGKLRGNVVHYKTGVAAVAGLKVGEVSAVMAPRSDLDAGLAGDTSGYVISTVATPGLSVTGWNLGLAVKSDCAELAQAVEKIMGDLLRDGTIQDIFKKHGIKYSPPL